MALAMANITGDARQKNLLWGSPQYEQQLRSINAATETANRTYNPPAPQSYFGVPTTGGGGTGSFYGGLSGLFGAPGSSLFGAPTTPAPGTNEFNQKLARISKNPRADQINAGFLEDLAGYKPNRGPIRAAAQNQMQEAAALGNRLSSVTNQNLGALESDKAANRQVLDSFISRFGTAQPKLDELTNTQVGVLDKFFAPASDPGSLEARQAGIRSRARTAETDLILPQVDRAILAGQIRSGISGVRKSNDYALRNTAVQLNRDSALRNAARESADLAALTSLQRSTAGLPQQLTTTNLLASKLPMDVRLELMQKETGLTGEALRQALAAQSGTISNLTAANSLENANDPLIDMARRQAILGQSTNQFNDNNFLSAAVPGNPLPLQVPGVQRYNTPQFPSYGGYGGDGGLEDELYGLGLGGGGGGGGGGRPESFSQAWGSGGSMPTYADTWGGVANGGNPVYRQEPTYYGPGGGPYSRPYTGPPSDAPVARSGWDTDGYADDYDWLNDSGITSWNNPLSEDYNPFA